MGVLAWQQAHTKARWSNNAPSVEFGQKAIACRFWFSRLLDASCSISFLSCCLGFHLCVTPPGRLPSDYWSQWACDCGCCFSSLAQSCPLSVTLNVASPTIPLWCCSCPDALSSPVTRDCTN